ncbi:hypothetical protein C7405_11758 [Paraburkholderia caballeronis]|uniref:hypothetical protein n=1 Tax=Paraburkholderia caballeronis TaxID=416943 RepID=UPI0010646312|nr:hypothetical protein [Paraburkholderia caballeronis]TDV27292.1 hypothetical protein C7405_11758 [Paraburkholderia caballeronis]
MSTDNPTSLEISHGRVGHAWDTLSAARDWNAYALAYQGLMRECMAANIAIWQDSVAGFAHGQSELGAVMRGACRGCVAAWEAPWWASFGALAPAGRERDAAHDDMHDDMHDDAAEANAGSGKRAAHAE